MLYPRRAKRGPLRKPADQLIEKFLGTDLEMERVAAIFHAYVEKLSDVSLGWTSTQCYNSMFAKSIQTTGYKWTNGKSKKRDILTSRIDQMNNGNGGFPGTVDLRHELKVRIHVSWELFSAAPYI